MNKLGLAQVLGTLIVSTLLGALPACYGDVPGAPGGDVAEAASAASDSAVVGRWQFVYDQSARAGYEARLAKEISDPAELEKAKAAGEKEAAASQIEFTEDGDFYSWVQGELVLSAPYVVGDATKETVRLSMSVEGQDRTTTVTLHGADEIVIDDPKKGPLTFRRAK